MAKDYKNIIDAVNTANTTIIPNRPGEADFRASLLSTGKPLNALDIAQAVALGTVVAHEQLEKGR